MRPSVRFPTGVVRSAGLYVIEPKRQGLEGNHDSPMSDEEARQETQETNDVCESWAQMVQAILGVVLLAGADTWGRTAAGSVEPPRWPRDWPITSDRPRSG